VTRYRLPFLLGVLLLLASSCGRRGDSNSEIPLAEGDRAPSFSLRSASGGSIKLSDYIEKKPALLYFSMGPG
jgi:hypothetical protein